MDAITQARRKGKITITEYMEITGKSRSTALRDIAALVNAGYLQRRGRGKGTYYIPVKKKL